eukprot:CFRG2039T1
MLGRAHPGVLAAYVGLIGYKEGLVMQQTLSSMLFEHKDTMKDVLLLCQHPPVYTLGRRLKKDDEEKSRLEALGAEYHKIGRGGQITFHGPGQLVGYPILDLGNYKKSVRCYVNQLEETMIRSCKIYDVVGQRTEDTGVWVKDKKIAALGVSVSRWITQHGFALNCDVDIKWFSHIVPCGIEGKGVTSLTNELGRPVSVELAIPHVVSSFADVFHCDITYQDFTKHGARTDEIVDQAMSI